MKQKVTKVKELDITQVNLFSPTRETFTKATELRPLYVSRSGRVVTIPRSEAPPGDLVNTDNLPEGIYNLYFTEERVLATILEGLDTLTTGKITDKDSVLSGFGKTQNQIDYILNTMEVGLPPGTVTQYLRGDKIWATLDKYAVGLGNVDNTSDLNKPISIATQAALDNKQGLITGGASSITDVDLEVDRPLISTGTGKVGILSTVTVTQVGFLSTLRYDVQVQIDGKVSITMLGQPDGVATLDGNGKVPLEQLNAALVGAVNYKGLWDAWTNTPTLPVPSEANRGWYYVVSVDGIYGTEAFNQGDWIISDGLIWGKVDNTSSVTTVFGRIGNITSAYGDYTASQILHVPTVDVPQVEVQSAIDALGTALTFKIDASATIETTAPLYGGGDLTTTRTIYMTKAGITTDGYLSATDWNIFNKKQDSFGFTPADDANVLHTTGNEVKEGNLVVYSVNGDALLGYALTGIGLTGITQDVNSVGILAQNTAGGDLAHFKGNAGVVAKVDNLGGFTGKEFVKEGGTSVEYLMADGSTSTGLDIDSITGQGTINKLARFVEVNVLGDSIIADTGYRILIKQDVDNGFDTLQVGGTGQFTSSVQVGHNMGAATKKNVGAIRYWEDASGSYVDICMNKDGTYLWTNIVKHLW